MIALAGGLAVAAVVGVGVGWLFGSATRSKWLGVLLALTLTTTLAFLPVAFAVGEDPTPGVSVSHAQLEADRVMTQQMGLVAGTGMDTRMQTDGMLERSSNPAYVAALERHVAEFNRMAGLP